MSSKTDLLGIAKHKNSVCFLSVCAIDSVSGDLALIYSTWRYKRALFLLLLKASGLQNHQVCLICSRSCDEIVLLAGFKCIIAASLGLFRRRICPLQIICVASQEDIADFFPVSSSVSIIDHWSSIQRRVQRYAALVYQWQWLFCAFPPPLHLSHLPPPRHSEWASVCRHLWTCMRIMLFTPIFDIVWRRPNPVVIKPDFLRFLLAGQQVAGTHKKTSYPLRGELACQFLSNFSQFSKPWSQNKYAATYQDVV